MKRTRRNQALGNIRSWVLVVFAGLAFLGAALRMIGVGAEVMQRLDETTLLYLAVGAALLLLQDVRSLSFGAYKVEFRERLEEVERAAESAKLQAEIAGREAVEPSDVAIPQDQLESLADAARRLRPGSWPDDPWADQFGGEAEANDRVLSASVTPIAGKPDWFRVHLEVKAKKGAPALTSGSPVQFFLHSTFADDRPIVTTGPDEVARLRLLAWGAFTVGVLTDGGQTQLELDLSDLKDAPRLFRDR
ncbi:MAG: pYEATS domain-containing protein [Planctomycetota bacterium]